MWLLISVFFTALPRKRLVLLARRMDRHLVRSNAALYTEAVRSAQRSQENNFSRSRPFRTSSALKALESTSDSSDARMDSTDSGSKKAAAWPTTSGQELDALHATGQPKLMASSGGMPNPSYKDGNTNAVAAR